MMDDGCEIIYEKNCYKVSHPTRGGTRHEGLSLECE